MNSNANLPIRIDKIIQDTNIVQTIIKKAISYNETKKIFLSGISTGYKILDDALDGLQKQQLITLAARTGMGKSWIALNLIKNIAIDQKIPVALFSLEMSHAQIIYRLLSMHSNVEAKKIKRGILDINEINEINSSSKILQESPLFISDAASNGNLKLLVQNITAIQDVDLIIIDHIGLIKNNKNQNNRVSEVGDITRELKVTAKNKNIPIVCLAQLNRNADKDEAPRLSDLRESGSIEQDSDVVLFAHRSDYYNSNTREKELDLIISKNRDGEQGITINFNYEKNTWIIREDLTKHQGKKQKANIELANRKKRLDEDEQPNYGEAYNISHKKDNPYGKKRHNS